MDGGAWKPIDPAKTYLAATNNFVRQGGDGYKVFATNGQNAYDYGPGLEQVVADYLQANRPYTPKLDGRITEIGAAMAQAEKPAEAAPAADAKLPELPAASSDIAANPPKADAPAAGAAAETAAAPAAKPADAAAANVARDRCRRQFLEPRQDLLQRSDQMAGDRRRQPGQPAAHSADRHDADDPAIGNELSVSR